MRQFKHNSRSSERGSLLVESTLVLLVFTAGVLAIFDIAQLVFVHQTMNERIRSGLRWASVNAYSETGVRNMVLYSDPDPEPGATPLFHLEPGMVAVRRESSGDTSDRVVIAIRNYPLTFITPGIAGTVTGREISATIPYEYEH